MDLRIEDIIGRPRDSTRERELARQLRELPVEQRYQFIQTLLIHHLAIGLKMARSCLRDKKHFEEILNIGLELGDASSILFWLECVVPKLGLRRVISILTAKLDDKPKAVGKALYWLPRFLRADDAKTKHALTALMDLAEQRGVITKPKIIPNPKDPTKVLFEKIED